MLRKMQRSDGNAKGFPGFIPGSAGSAFKGLSDQEGEFKGLFAV